MTTPITTFEDILAAMENNPQLQAAMRQHILDQEFLQLPAIVRELQQTVAQLAQLVQEYITSNDARLARLEGSMERLESSMERLQGDMNYVRGNLNRMIGTDYERTAAKRATRLAQRHLLLSDMRLIYAMTLPDDAELLELVDRALAAGRIDNEEAADLENADLILAGPDRYVVAETSVTVDDSDIRSARHRADLLQKATTIATTAAVIGAHALDSAVEYAVANNVAVIIMPE